METEAEFDRLLGRACKMLVHGALVWDQSRFAYVSTGQLKVRPGLTFTSREIAFAEDLGWIKLNVDRTRAEITKSGEFYFARILETKFGWQHGQKRARVARALAAQHMGGAQ